MKTHTSLKTRNSRLSSFAAMVPGALAAASLLTVPAASAQCDPDWVETPGFGFPGTNGIVFASTRWDPDGDGPEPELLVIGGMFTAVDTTPANSVAAWDGTTWTNLGGGVTDGTIFERVSALGVYDGKLVVGGHFGAAGGVPVSNIAMWDGTTWTSPGGGVFGDFSENEVQAMAVYDGKLIVGGAFTRTDAGPAEHVAAWDGTNWSALGAGAAFAVNALESFEGELYMGGQFSSAGNQPQTDHIAKWDGTNWSSVGGNGANGVVFSLHAHDGRLYAGGRFQSIGNAVVNQIASWDGTDWLPLGDGVFGTVFALDSTDDHLYVGGSFQSAGGQSAGNAARWDGFAWESLGAGVDGFVNAVQTFGDDLFVGGNFQTADGRTARGAALWSTAGWRSFPGRPLNIEPRGLEVFQGDLVATGYADIGNGTRNSAVLRWDGLEWSNIGLGFNELVWDTGIHNGELHALGWFSTADGNPARGIARWDGSMWTGLGSGFAGGFVTSGLCMSTFEGNLIVGGDFSSAGGTPANNIARWDGAAWSALGDGLTGGLGCTWKLVPFLGDLVAVGEFTIAGNAAANGTARWDGTQWHPLGGGLTGGILPGGRSATIFEGDLIVGGSFTHAGGTPAANIARWDGTEWTALGAGLPDHGVEALVVYNGQLYAGGQFIFNDESNTRITRWTGTEWEIVGGGVDGGVGEFAVLESELFMTGGFAVAGDTVAPGLARWSDTRAPWFALHPEAVSTTLGQTVALDAAVAAGYEDATLRWRRDGVPLDDGPTGFGSVISGATTGTLTITGARAADAGDYDCLADNGCAQTPSDAAALTVCVADFNGDTTINTQDVLDFLNAWNAGHPLADIDNDGEINTRDVLAFLNAWNTGC